MSPSKPRVWALCKLPGQERLVANEVTAIYTADSILVIEHAAYTDLLAKAESLAEVLSFYARALEEADYGEPNEDPHLMPAKLGTRASKALARFDKFKEGLE